MKRLALILFTILSLQAFAQVDVPDFSFRGQEEAEFTIPPAFKNVDLSISVPSEYRNYVDKQTLGVAENSSNQYNAEEPGGIYAFRPLSSIAAAFVGEKAYRNYFVKTFINGSYDSIVLDYPDYINDFQDPVNREEVDFLYAASMVNTQAEGGMELLKNACATGNHFKAPACDRYAEILWQNGDQDGIIELGDNMERPYSTYMFSTYVLAYLGKGDYDKVSALLAANPDLVFQYSDFNDLRSLTEYNKSNYPAVTKLAAYSSDRMAFINADSFINVGDYKRAAVEIDKVENPQDRNYLLAKNDLGMRRNSDAIRRVANVPSEEDRLSLLKYYVATNFGKLDDNVINAFNLHGSYINYYKGLQAFQNGDYARATALLETVTEPEDLATQARFYRGIAKVYTDPENAEQDIVATMNNSTDPAQAAAARFMLAQLYYLKGQNTEAMQLLDGCNNNDCKQLRAEINIQNGDFAGALDNVSAIDTPQARLIRASAYYNMMDYPKAEQELSAVDSKSQEVQYLKMKMLFKNGDIAGAKAILLANRNYKPILYDGVREIMLTGDYQLATQLLENENDLPPDMQVIKAKLLAWSGRPKEAHRIYTSLLAQNQQLYDSIFGLTSLEASPQAEIRAIKDVLPRMAELPEFPQKDLLLSQYAAKAAAAKDDELLVQIINSFFPAYDTSPYAGDLYAERAKLFQSTGRPQECITDIDNAIAKNALLAEELRFMKANCTEETDMAAALRDYKTMFMEDDRYGLPAAVKIMDLSEDSTEVLDVAMQIREDNPQLFVEGIRRYMEIATAADLISNEAFVNSLNAESNTALASAGLYGKARIQNERGQARDAARTYEQIYKTDPKDHFAAPGLDAAIIIYKELRLGREAADAAAAKAKL
ncbi:MAG: hypothetical protein LBV04_07815 [Deferribacteraceae bacterium]|jgi:hypothetical protein|nr:hypothetical protein [Deferribacteraceae bacterium]